MQLQAFVMGHLQLGCLPRSGKCKEGASQPTFRAQKHRRELWVLALSSAWHFTEGRRAVGQHQVALDTGAAPVIMGVRTVRHLFFFCLCIYFILKMIWPKQQFPLTLPINSHFHNPPSCRWYLLRALGYPSFANKPWRQRSISGHTEAHHTLSASDCDQCAPSGGQRRTGAPLSLHPSTHEGNSCSEPWGERLGGTGEWEAQHEPAMCACSPESQPDPGLHQEKRGQQVEGGDSAPLVRSRETPLGVLRPALEPQT